MQHVADYRQQLQDGYNVVESVATTTTSSIILVPTYALCQPAANTCCSYYMAVRPLLPEEDLCIFSHFYFKKPRSSNRNQVAHAVIHIWQ